jgi:hypothetical protein
LKVGENHAHFWVLKNGLWPLLSGLFEKCGEFWRRIRTILVKFVAICPLLKPRFGQQKPSIYAGLRAQSPLSHFFS